MVRLCKGEVKVSQLSTDKDHFQGACVGMDNEKESITCTCKFQPSARGPESLSVLRGFWNLRM